ncbi:MAG: glycoside hydrolase family 28 protein [Blautia sp.]|nr:glycoside hydrolase family 28 protein [Blautia sp.]
MKIQVLFLTARSCVLEIPDGGLYETLIPWEIWLNGKYYMTTRKVITNLFGLKPDTDYRVEVSAGAGGDDPAVTAAGRPKTQAASLNIEGCEFTTLMESVTLNVRDFGAKGDASTDDTLAIQTAIAACPPDGRVLIPKGIYRFHCLQLKSNLNLCMEKGAVLSAFTDEEALPMLPGVIQTWDEKGEYNLSTWEGNPLPGRAGLISGFYADQVVLYGEGVIDGCAGFENWWRRDRIKRLPARPRLFFLNHCSNVTVQGLTFTNSPSWTIHPYFSDHLAFYGTCVKNPADSHNTDGLDPESCEDVKIIGMYFSVGDDCIAIKSGKIYMARKYGVPSQKLLVRQCLLQDGHGAVTIGSEMAGGVLDLKVEDCVFRRTDRGLRIKTRRGRGERAVVDRILFKNIRMEEVLTPIVVNSFYFCDPDGHTSYVQSREAFPVDERTPRIGSLRFEGLTCENTHVQAAYVEGLPEQKIEEVSLKDVAIRFAGEPKAGISAMTEGVTEGSRQGFFAANIKTLRMESVCIEGQSGEKLICKGVEHLL